MAEQNKILTVSYGTFSCTLEGFDDSFGTMKAIAEYFRDLAADDRYFGAEPPTPDAEMLTRIAEREIARRVEARTSEAGIVLRASEALAAPAPLQPAAAPAAAPAPAPVQDKVEETTEAAPQPAPEPETSSAPEPARDPAPETASPAPEAETADAPGSEADAAAEAVDALLASADPEADTDDAAADAVAGEDDSAESDESEAEPVAEVEDEVLAEAAEKVAEAQPTSQPDPESIAAKLQRIRAVVGKSAALSDGSEDAAEADAASASAASLAATRSSLAAIMGRSEADDADEAETAEYEDEDEISPFAETADEDFEEADESAEPVRARVVRMDPDLGAAPAAPDDGDEDYEDEAPATVSPRYSGLAGLDGAEELEATFGGDSDDDDLDADLLEELAMVEEDSDEAARTEDDDSEELAATDDADDDGMDEWTEMTQAGTAGRDDLVYDAAPTTENAFADLDTDDSDDDVDFGDDDIDDAAELDEDDDTGEDKAPVGRRDRLGNAPVADEAALSRLMSEADAKMAEPEGRGRREAIAHLKAAVAATEAARQLGETDTARGGDENAFRDDLKEAVQPTRQAGPSRPTRPVAERTRTERPRPAPLKLVASQRIDTSTADGPAPAAVRQSGPVRPRRISREETGSAAGENGFATWAEARGAHSLTDLVEAAAAHTTEVDGVEQFGRPQIMRKVRAARAEEANREDELRAFGTLLRQGRFEKVKAGRFRLSDDSRFITGPRAARG